MNRIALLWECRIFAPEFQTPEQYIIDITYRIWEERGVGLINEWYAADGLVRSPHGVTNTVDAVVRHTLETMHQFPERKLFAEDIIIGDKSDRFLFLTSCAVYSHTFRGRRFWTCYQAADHHVGNCRLPVQG